MTNNRAKALEDMPPDEVAAWAEITMGTWAIEHRYAIREALTAPQWQSAPFICGMGGDDPFGNGMKEIITVCPAYGSDATYTYKLIYPLPPPPTGEKS